MQRSSQSTATDREPAVTEGLMQFLGSDKTDRSQDYSGYFDDYIQLGINVASVLKTLEQNKSALRRDLTVSLVHGTSAAFQNIVLDINARYAQYAGRKSTPEKLSSHPLLSPRRIAVKSRVSSVTQHELRAYAAVYTTMLGGRSGAATDYFVITDSKDYFYLRYK
jgi:hypothetical protein